MPKTQNAKQLDTKREQKKWQAVNLPCGRQFPEQLRKHSGDVMPKKQSFIPLTDQFCGAGGSSIGATMAGAEVRLAMNHWKLAIETHNTNFPKVDHDCTDIS